MTDQGHLRALDGGAERGLLETRRLRDQARHRRAGRDARARVRLPARRRPSADRGRAGPREDADREDRRRRVRRQVRARSSSRPTSCRPTSSARGCTAQRSEEFDIELGPVFCNFLLADEINRAPAKVQSALLEVMQERQVTIGKETYPVPRAVPRHGDAEPDRVRGHVPAARGAGRPLHAEDRRRLPGRGRRADRDRARARRPGRRRAARLGRGARGAAARRRAASTSTRPSRATRSRSRSRRAGSPTAGSADLAEYVAYGASPRGPINLVLGARALAAAARPPLRAARRTSASSRRTCCATGWC